MSKISDSSVYPITEMVSGATVIGSLPSGGTVQFSISGILDFITGNLDFVNYDKATKAGQTIMGNDPDFPETYNANINEGYKYLGTIKNFPPNDDDDMYFITKLRQR